MFETIIAFIIFASWSRTCYLWGNARGWEQRGEYHARRAEEMMAKTEVETFDRVPSPQRQPLTGFGRVAPDLRVLK
jgi:hypothetical protein